jgi:Methylamine utilisation protein MauE
VNGPASSVSLLLAGLFALAGVAKLHRPTPIAMAIRKLLPRRVTVRRRAVLLAAGLALGAIEVVLSVALVAATGRAAVAVSVAVVVLGLVFVAAVLVAIRRGAACGCWAALSTGPAGSAELIRAAGVVVLGLVLLAARAQDDRRPSVTVATVAGGFALGAAWAALARLAARLRPDRTRKARRNGEPPPSPMSISAFLRGPGGTRDRLAPAGPDSSALTGRVRRRVITELRRDPTVVAADQRAEAVGGLRWHDAAATLLPRPPHGAARPRVVSVTGPAGSLRVVQSPDGAVAVMGTLGGTPIMGVGGELREQSAPASAR